MLRTKRPVLTAILLVLPFMQAWGWFWTSVLAADPTPRPTPVVVGIGIVPDYEKQMLSAIRSIRGDNIPTHSLLMRIAEQRAQDITTNYSHDGAGVPGVEQWGEILTWNSYPTKLTAFAAVNSWENSAGHNSVLMGNWTHVGVGHVRVGHQHYYAAVFANIYVGPLPATDTVTLVNRRSHYLISS